MAILAPDRTLHRLGREQSPILEPPRHRLEQEAEQLAQRVTGRRRETNFEAGSVGWMPGLSAGPETASQHGAGQPIPSAVRVSFEQRFGHDFSRVRVHTDSNAAERARALGADAYAVGHHIGFAPGLYAPHVPEGERLLAHELTHVIQQGRAAPLVARGSGHGDQLRRSPVAVMPYRSKKSPNFGSCDSTTLKEAPFTDRDKDPWIEKITIDFNGTGTDSDGDLVPTGSLVASYFANSARLANITAPIVGGKASEGLSDRDDAHTVTRIEGCGYHHTSVPKKDRVTGHERGFKYFKPGKTGSASMSFAVFYKEGKGSGNQAIHKGSLSLGSLACVHVADDDKIRQINYHSRKGVTKVALDYGSTALAKVCCARFAVKGFMVSNPCKGQDSSKCP